MFSFKRGSQKKEKHKERELKTNDQRKYRIKYRLKHNCKEICKTLYSVDQITGRRRDFTAQEKAHEW